MSRLNANVVRERIFVLVGMAMLWQGCGGSGATTPRQEQESPATPGDGDDDAPVATPPDDDSDEPRPAPFPGDPSDGEHNGDAGLIGDLPFDPGDAGTELPPEDPPEDPPTEATADAGVSGGEDAAVGGEGDGQSDSDAGPGGDGDSTGGGDGDQGPVVDPVCQVPAVFAHWAGTPVLTRAALDACLLNCGDDLSCQSEENCPGIDEFRSCWAGEMQACTGSVGGLCREPTEAVECCDFEKCGGDGLCREEQCAGELSALAACWESDLACAATAKRLCLAH